jgi:hypothetical protein
MPEQEQSLVVQVQSPAGRQQVLPAQTASAGALHNVRATHSHHFT